MQFRSGHRFAGGGEAGSGKEAFGGSHAFVHDVAAERCFCLRAENVGQVVRVHVDFLGDGGAAQFRIGKMRTDMNILVY